MLYATPAPRTLPPGAIQAREQEEAVQEPSAPQALTMQFSWTFSCLFFRMGVRRGSSSLMGGVICGSE